MGFFSYLINHTGRETPVLNVDIDWLVVQQIFHCIDVDDRILYVIKKNIRLYFYNQLLLIFFGKMISIDKNETSSSLTNALFIILGLDSLFLGALFFFFLSFSFCLSLVVIVMPMNGDEIIQDDQSELKG